VLAQATGFALLAAISPTALLVMAVFLGSANPRETALMYVAGALLMTVAMAIVVLLVLRGVGLDQPREREARYALRLGLGVVAIAAAAFVSRRGRRTAAGSQGQAAAQGPPMLTEVPVATESLVVDVVTAKKPGLVTRLTANPRPLTAFLAGLLLFAPSATFIAAVQVIATADAGTPVIILALLIVITISALTVWLPLLAYLAFPDATTRRLRNVNDWLRTHSRLLLTGALWVGGVALVVNGALGLWR
jgi:hypothetical protein